MHVLWSKRQAMLPVEQNYVREDSSGENSQQLSPKSVPALVHSAPWHKDAGIAVTTFTFLLPLSLHFATHYVVQNRE
jgi:hypothetical protein